MGKLTHTDLLTPLSTGKRSGQTPRTWLKPGALQLAVSLALCTPALSQSVTDFSAQEAAPEAPATPYSKPAATEAIPAPEEKETEPISAMPSRFVGEADFDAYIQSYSMILSAKNRETDPFGQYQDPTKKPIIKAPTRKRQRRSQPTKATPVSEIVKLINVTTIMPTKKCFLLGTTRYKQGETLNLVFRSKEISVEVVSVSSRKIDFRNLENDDLASLSLNLMPGGMTRGNSGITAPGMISDRKNAPIDLDASRLPDPSLPTR